jgi:hypothetical protein
MIGTVIVGNCFSQVQIENDRIQSASFRPIIVDGASFTIVKNTSSRRIPKLLVSISFDDEEILGKSNVSYRDDI